jgi:ankyrin repeat protein
MAAQAAVEAMFRAVEEEGNVDEVVRLLDADHRLVEARDEYQRTPLMWAAHRGHVGIVRVLLERGAGVNAVTGGGSTVLHLAAFRGHREVVDLLLRYGAEASRRNAWGATPLMTASIMGHLCVVRSLVQHRGRQGLNQRSTDGQTALWRACYRGHEEVARYLLLAGADHTITDIQGRTPRQIARDRGHGNCVALMQVR